MDQEITESHLPGQYLDIALVPGQYLDIALAAGQYKIYCPALAFDPPTQSVTYTYYKIHHKHTCSGIQHMVAKLRIKDEYNLHTRICTLLNYLAKYRL